MKVQFNMVTMKDGEIHVEEKKDLSKMLTESIAGNAEFTKTKRERAMELPEGFYKNGKPVDKWLWYYDSGNILKEESYLKGVENGLIIEYSDSGNVIVSGQYIMGIKEGIWIYEMGDQKETGNYMDGKKNGIWQHLYKNGNVNFEGEFVDGEPNGKHKYYYESGKIKEEGSYVMGVKQGSWKKYDNDGVLIVVVAYEGGEEIKINGIKIETDSK